MEELFIRGDQIASYTSISGNGNGAEREVTLNGVTALGTSDQLFRVVVEQTGGGDEFSNGQFVTIYAPDGSIVRARNGINPDAEQGAASGDEYQIFTQGPNLVIDLNGFPAGSTTRVYSHQPSDPSVDGDQAGDPDIGDNDGNLDFADVSPDFGVICFTPGTMIAVPSGHACVESIPPGAVVLDINGSPRKVLWNGARKVRFETRDSRRPVLIRQGALGAGSPARDLVVSPQHRIRLTGPAIRDAYGSEAVLAPARGLVELGGIREMRGKRSVTYVSLLLDRHAVIDANGAAAESLYPGPQAMRALTRWQRAQITRAVPGLAAEGASAYGAPAHRCLTVGETRRLVSAPHALKARAPQLA